MKESPENLTTGQPGQIQSTERGVDRGSRKVCPFPAVADTEIQIAKATAEKLKIPFVDPLRAHIEPDAVAMLKPDIAMRRQALPIRRVGGILLVAMASPGEQIGVRSLEVLTGCQIHPAAAPRSSLFAVLHKVYEQQERVDDDKGRQPVEIPADRAVEQEETGPLTISVISNKGGVGKTHLSINLAHALAKTGAKVLLIDADLGNADVSNKLGLFPKYHLLDFLEKTRHMQDLVVTTKFEFDLICSAYGEFKLANLNYAQKMKFIRHFKKIGQGYDFVMFDLGAGIARMVLDFALAADCAVIVTTPQDLVSGYACAKAAFSRFKEVEKRLEERFPEYSSGLTFSPMLVLNQLDDLEQGVILYDRIGKIADRNINANEGRFCIKPEYLGGIPYDRENFRKAEVRRRPLILDSPYVKVSQCIQHMSTRFLNGEDSYQSGVTFRHSFRRFVAVMSQRF